MMKKPYVVAWTSPDGSAHSLVFSTLERAKNYAETSKVPMRDIRIIDRIKGYTIWNLTDQDGKTPPPAADARKA
jgi:hypothetical protein